MEFGFEPLPGWECLFFHRPLKLILSAYVDDFKLVGKKSSMTQGWDLITNRGLVLETTLSVVSSQCMCRPQKRSDVWNMYALCYKT